jgi:hypothetical protein
MYVIEKGLQQNCCVMLRTTLIMLVDRYGTIRHEYSLPSISQHVCTYIDQ